MGIFLSLSGEFVHVDLFHHIVLVVYEGFYLVDDSGGALTDFFDYFKLIQTFPNIFFLRLLKLHETFLRLRVMTPFLCVRCLRPLIELIHNSDFQEMKKMLVLLIFKLSVLKSQNRSDRFLNNKIKVSCFNK